LTVSFAGHAGAIIDQIQDRFEITALEQHNLDQPNAAEFLEVYKGVIPEYNVRGALCRHSRLLWFFTSE
jgi:alkanesulfonate monooxygenase SsuD/methylene tetrahydromethanopterin reductase-like flavin-dependent oxidoreductase (luciferase family)